MNILVVIPARGGSKGIPRKNLRMLNGKPLLYYTINNAISSKYDLDVYVSSEDDEILNTAVKLGAKTHRRPAKIADDKSTLDPVIYDCYLHCKEVEAKDYDLIVTMQPTSPLLSPSSLDKSISLMLEDSSIDTIIAAKDATHLSWRKEEGKFIPNYTERLNRQYLTPSFTETGAFLITRNTIISENNRIGKKVELSLLSMGEDIDIDTYEDWNLCEYYLKRKHILFVITGNSIVGLGHVYNTLLVANDILNHQVSFLVDKDSKLAYDVIKGKNYPVHIQENESIIDDIIAYTPDIVINDRLDTDLEYINALKDKGCKVINFEDLGEGSKAADVVINAIYPEKEVLDAHYFGQDYFILRDEFMLSETKKIKDDVKQILITFGGVDPNNYTLKVIETINDFCIKNDIEVIVIAGFGYGKYESLQSFKNVKIMTNVSNISDYMLSADLIFTSAGRTIYEVASIGTPAIVLGQNEREMTHFFASAKYGFLNLGLGYDLADELLFDEFHSLVTESKKRVKMSLLMQEQQLKLGRRKVNKIINEVIESI